MWSIKITCCKPSPVRVFNILINFFHSLRIYKQLVTRYASRKNRYSYLAAIEALRRIAQLLKKQQRQNEFSPYVESLCRKHRYQHAFVKMLRQLMARHSRRKNHESR